MHAGQGLYASRSCCVFHDQDEASEGAVWFCMAWVLHTLACRLIEASQAWCEGTPCQCVRWFIVTTAKDGALVDLLVPDGEVFLVP